MALDMKRGRLILLLLVVVAQLSVPVFMIRAREATLNRGNAYRFQTAPVDPVDVFRGRYVALNYTQAMASVRKGVSIRRGQWVYARVELDDDGFAQLKDVSGSRPDEGDYLRVRARRSVSGGDSSTAAQRQIRLSLPFTRFYMDEKKAPAAEQAVWQARSLSAEERQESYAVVRIHRGRSVLEDVVVGGVPIVEAAESVLEETARQGG